MAKQPKFEFTVEAVSEKEQRRLAKEAARAAKGGPTLDLERRSPGADPGRLEWVALIAVVLLLPMVYMLQQYTRYLHGETLSDAPAEVRRSEAVEDPGVAELTVMSKLAVKLTYLDRDLSHNRQHRQPEPRKQGPDSGKRPGSGPQSKKPAPPSEPDEEIEEDDSGDSRISMAQLDSRAWTRVDRLRVAIVAGELHGPDDALARLSALEKETTPGSELASDIGWLKVIYEKGPGEIDQRVAQSLIDRHGWFGRLALSLGRPATDAYKRDVVGGGKQLAVVTVVLLIVLALVSLAGFIMAAAAFVKFRRTGYLLRFTSPEKGGSVYIETFGVFLGGFALLLLIGLMLFGLGVEGSHAAAGINEVMLWALVATAFWPRLRGVSWTEWSQSMGLHRGEGILKEVACGALGYLAAQPLDRLAHWIGQMVEHVTNTGEPEPSFGYGMFEAPAQGSWALFVLSMLSAVVWAPMVEESLFRGALMRYLSGRLNLLWSVVISSALFGFIHPYTTAGLVEVGLSGTVFGFLRLWRGSLIAPTVAHALHNGMISALTAGFVVMLGD